MVGSQVEQRRENLDELLYNDAERRRRDNQKKKESLDKARNAPIGKGYHNKKSDQYVR
jgi:hypothetical protein